MERRQFMGAAGSLLAAGPAQAQKESEAGGTGSTSYTLPVTIERKLPGKPHRGKVLAAFTVPRRLDQVRTAIIILDRQDRPQVQFLDAQQQIVGGLQVKADGVRV